MGSTSTRSLLRLGAGQLLDVDVLEPDAVALHEDAEGVPPADGLVGLLERLAGVLLVVRQVRQRTPSTALPKTASSSRTCPPRPGKSSRPRPRRGHGSGTERP